MRQTHVRGWAGIGTVGSTQQDAVDITLLLRWNGSAWQVVDRGVYCDNGDVPKSIYQNACQSN